ncbi:3-keto-disaccharide hydrolase [Alienimonas californiensis]|uniref:3-keto-alpha-glucoside-1,2-lyase/3-keto-2-hydroxy-glucal hydratase domain-containing protein n=1 Tax=Alienimonas californiensis TaxID=2527989 RepID=A0A517P6D8_9PLAN|nr:DUF1080 domain-containing protein [Alienimonas californiensis]QDT14936.1 hypothetical protein CA12_10160 [Alienimonas californiensis]
MLAALLLVSLGIQDGAERGVPQMRPESPAGQFEKGFTPLFDGETLDGWNGREGLWSVEDGAIVGRTNDEKPLEANTFLVLEKPAENFDLRLKYKIESGNSGVQYRAEAFDEEAYRVRGPQADIDSSPQYTGIHYSEGARGIVAVRGQKVKVVPDGKKGKNETVGSSGDAAELQAKHIKSNDWNEYRIVADGPTMRHYVNGQLMSEVTDERPDREKSGVIALQLHRGPPMVVRFKDVRIKRLK